MATETQIRELRDQHYNASVVSIRKSHDDLMVIRLKPDFAMPPHRAGQYTTIGMGSWEARRPDAMEETAKALEETKLIRRAYSISHPILDDHGRLVARDSTDYLEFYIALLKTTDSDKPPHLTPRIYMLKEGDRLYVGERITGQYTLASVQPDDAVVFLSTGTGEAPHNFMVWELLSQGHRGPLVFVTCVRIRSDLAYRDTHERLAAMYPQFHYIALTTREPDQAGRKVYIQDAIQSGELEQTIGFLLKPEQTQVFLCGNPKMIGIPHHDKASGTKTYPTPLGAVEVLERRGFRESTPHGQIPGNIHYEKYW